MANKTGWKNMVSIAQCACDYLNGKYKEHVIRNGNADGFSWSLDCGKVDDLHSIYELYAERNGVGSTERAGAGHKPGSGSHVRRSVLSALRQSVSGKTLFDAVPVTNLYPGIVPGNTYVFRLKDEFKREYAPEQYFFAFEENYRIRGKKPSGSEKPLYRSIHAFECAEQRDAWIGRASSEAVDGITKKRTCRMVADIDEVLELVPRETFMFKRGNNVVFHRYGNAGAL